MASFTERETVQKPIIEYATQIGWEYIKPEEAERQRGNNTSIILGEIFINQLKKLNPDFSEKEIQQVLRELENIYPENIEGNLTAWEYLKGIRAIFVEAHKRHLNIKLIDTENIENNAFHVSEEFTFTDGTKTIRQDIVFFINGIPLIFVEAKAPHVLEAINNALEQVKRYHRDTPKLLAVEQVYVLTNYIRLVYGATWNDSNKNLYNWKEERQGSFEDLIKAFFNRERMIKLLTDYILFARKDEKLEKVILRPHQIRAIEKAIERAKDPEKKRGLIWHTQGSGKTYTMIVLAKKLIENPIFNNPTVIMLVDRTELESQLFNNLNACGFENVEVTENKEHLKELLRSDKRGLIVSMIHKFEGMPANLNTRKNIFVLIDEAHRTTSGKLGNYLMGALPNATYIGFTGTPIDKTAHGNSTFLIFGKDDPPHGYLDKYSIAQSIEDGTTVRLHYSLASNELRIDKDLLEKEFLNLKDAEGISDVEELNRILDKAVNLKNAIKSKNRIEKIAKFIAQHFKENVEPLGYKAFVVAVDREACVLYKQELDKHLPEEYSKVVISPFYNDPEEMKKYHLTEEEEKRIRKDFVSPDKNPKILIVTNKLLTGFDAPVLYCMYLDKPMRDHVLLQTIARVNRPYEDEQGRKKPAGLIIDFIGIFDNLEKALAFDSSDIGGIVEDIQKLKERFKELMEEGKRKYLEPLKGLSQSRAMEKILEDFNDEEKRKGFYEFYKEVSRIYDILSPDEFLRPYLADMEVLTKMYRIIKEAYEPSARIDREISKKVEELVRKYVIQSDINIKDGLEVYEIDENILKKLEEERLSDTEKIYNLSISIEKLVEKEGLRLPYLISIGERAKAIMEQYKRRQLSTNQALEEIKKLIEEINRAKLEQAQMKIDDTQFSIYWLLKEKGIEKAKEIAEEFYKVLQKYPYWKTSSEHERAVKKELLNMVKDINLIKEIIDKLKIAYEGKGL
ncbi:HsdR family type I site-specific deoxyribonuclease [Hydrogenobacter thermophilus]|uniref:type I restriction endonuclease subunit R n=1 Tax=Hydrogenobacter thermophilus TaxID=940 RepID=UPI0030F826E9